MKPFLCLTKAYYSVLFSFYLVGSLCLTVPATAGESKGDTKASPRSILWVEQAGGSKHDKIRGIAVDGAGNCFVTGEFTEQAQFADKTVTSRGNMDFVLAKYNPQGKLLWLQTAGGTEIDRGYAVAV
ncbi:MAG: SBBP repeat-containing protein, partial [Planctomycetaceae bacterium]|nr:SBBP repeat-containing protein [Planctomycetaceae bacterium]